MAMSRPVRGERFVVVDSQVLGRLISEAIDTGFGGSQSEAARRVSSLGSAEVDVRVIGARQKTLSRIARGQPQRISHDTYQLLRQVLIVAGLSGKLTELERLIMAPEARRLVTEYRGWLAAEGRSTPDTPDPEEWLGLQLDTKERQHLWNKLEELCPKEVARFRLFVRERGHHDARTQLSLERILRPLLQHQASGGIERDWEELSERELAQYLKASQKAEEILLSRPPDLERAQTVVGGKTLERVRERRGALLLSDKSLLQGHRLKVEVMRMRQESDENRSPYPPPAHQPR
ncbi:hypothetical protein ACGF5M_03060 [Gemmatimonadota bacterium]